MAPTLPHAVWDFLAAALECSWRPRDTIDHDFRYLALGAVALSTVLAAPSAHAANPVVKLKVSGSSKLLTYNPAVGLAQLQTTASAAGAPNTQRWEEIDGPGAAVFYRNVGNQQCLRANPNNSVFTRTVTCDFSDSATSRQQQWILSGGQLASRDRLINNNPANSLTADFANINRVVGLAPFKRTSNQVWSSFAG
jgi:hypothetical protein